MASYNSHQYTGHERDRESGLDYMLARFYGAAVGRFVSVDPSRRSAYAELPQTWNRYAYTLNNPVNRVDFDGQVSYLVSRESVAGQRHMFIVTGAAYPGDPNGKVHSYGKSSSKGSSGKVGKVDESTTGFSKGTAKTDKAAWASVGSDAAKKVDYVAIPAKDGKVESVAGALKENKDYHAAAGPNSNSAAQAVADKAAGVHVEPPAPEHMSVNPVNPTGLGETAETPGAADESEMEFDEAKIKADEAAGKHETHVPAKKP